MLSTRTRQTKASRWIPRASQKHVAKEYVLQRHRRSKLTSIRGHDVVMSSKTMDTSIREYLEALRCGIYLAACVTGGRLGTSQHCWRLVQTRPPPVCVFVCGGFHIITLRFVLELESPDESVCSWMWPQTKRHTRISADAGPCISIWSACWYQRRSKSLHHVAGTIAQRRYRSMPHSYLVPIPFRSIKRSLPPRWGS
jgi:hypothetical protein